MSEAATLERPARLREDLLHRDPLLDCMIEVCRAHGVSVSRAALSNGLPLPDGRLTLDVAERAAARAGMAAKLQRIALADIDPMALPAVAVLDEDRALVLVKRLDAGRWQVQLPETGGGVLTLEDADLGQRYAGVTLFMQPRLRFDERTPDARPAAAGHWFWGAVLGQRQTYRDVLWAALLINVFALAMPLFSMNVYDRVVPNHALETLWALAAGALLVTCFDLLMRNLRSRFVDEAGARIDLDISAVLMERVLGMQLANRPAAVGAFAANLRGFEQVRDFFASSTVTALIDLPFALIFLGIVAWLSPWLALPVLCSFVVVLIVGYVLQHRLHELSQTTWQAAAQRNATLVESLTGIETVKAQGAESLVQTRWEQINAHLSEASVRMRALSSGAMSWTAWLSQVVNIGIVVVGVYLISRHELTMGALIAAGMLAGRAMAPAGQIVGLLMQYQGARTALESLDKIMAQPVERPSDRAFIQRPQLRGGIEFRGVRFAYPGRKDPVIDNVSFKIAPGERVAFIGKVGSGKSTISRLLLGLYAPGDGAVLVDGIDLRQLDPADLRRNVGYVSQDTTLFYGSLRENIAYGLAHADDRAVIDAAAVAGLGEFVDRHPQGFEMPVGERGELLSGGQRQAVGIARAVLHHAPILVLDEPTSAMDFSSETHITAALGRYSRGKTLLLVTHRMSLLPLADRVIVVDNGRIMADGPREQIMQALSAGRINRAA